MNPTIHLFLSLGILLSPLYIFPSGNPQPADFLLIMFAFLVLSFAWMKKRSFVKGYVPLVWVALVFWIFAVCYGWFFFYQSAAFFKNALFWVYNLVVSTALIHVLISGEKGKHLVANAVVGGLIVSGVGLAIDLGTGIRVVGFFNNPNQLAYYSLCGLALLLILHNFEIKPRPFKVAAVLSGLGGIFAAASLAAMAGLFCLGGAYFLANLTKTRRILMLMAMTTALILLAFSLDQYLGGHASYNVERRLQSLDRKVGNVYGERNYDRMAAFPEYMILGAGEGHFERFYPHDRNEIHSSFGNLLFAYGIPGLMLFLMLLYKLIRHAPLPVWLVLVAPLVYSITHMGLRSTMFWFLLATIWAQYGLAKKRLWVRTDWSTRTW